MTDPATAAEPAPPRRRRKWAPGIAVAAVLIVAGAVVGPLVGLGVIGGSGSAAPAQADRATSSPPPSSISPPTTAAVLTPVDPTVAYGLPSYDTVVAYAQPSSIGVYPAPGAASPTSSLSNPNNLGAPLVFRVTRVAGPWIEVMLPVRPNGSRGWVREADVKLFSDEYRVGVLLGARTLVLYKDGQEIERQPVIVGSPSAPTPTGDFYATELLKAPNSSGPYGPYAFGLSGFSDVFSEFEGGPGQIAIHGTNVPQYIGQAISHGCVRMRDEDIARLAGVLPVGSPVLISP